MQCTEFVDLLIRSRSLSSKLIARNIKHLKSLIMIILIQLLDRLILWCKSAACRGVYNKDYLTLVIRKTKAFTGSRSYFVIIDYFVSTPFVFCFLLSIMMIPTSKIASTINATAGVFIKPAIR